MTLTSGPGGPLGGTGAETAAPRPGSSPRWRRLAWLVAALAVAALVVTWSSTRVDPEAAAYWQHQAQHEASTSADADAVVASTGSGYASPGVSGEASVMVAPGVAFEVGVADLACFGGGSVTVSTASVLGETDSDWTSVNADTVSSTIPCDGQWHDVDRSPGAVTSWHAEVSASGWAWWADAKPYVLHVQGD